MPNIGFVFPGQGSQKVGMGKDLFAKYESVRNLYNQASEILGRDIAAISFEGPEEELIKTENAQIAIFLVSAGLFSILANENIKPSYVAGHSLGELTAYYAAGVYDLQTAINIIKARGAAMASSYPADKSAMAAVMGASVTTIQEVLDNYKDYPVVIANYNSPNQFVISGNKDGVAAVSVDLKEKGVKRIIPLAVSGPFHSPLMEPAAEEFKAYLKDVTFNDAAMPIVLNRTGAAEDKKAALKENLALQLKSSVQWTQSVEYLTTKVDTVVECGYGKVLTGLMKKIVPDKNYINVYDVESLESFLSKEIQYV